MKQFHMNSTKAGLLVVLSLLIFSSCSKKDDATDPVTTATPTPKLIFKFKFDSTQVRLNNFGQVAVMPAGHSGQSPVFNAMSAHYIELAPDSLTWLGGGKILYRAPETTLGGSTAIDFDSSVRVGEGQVFYSMPLTTAIAGTYRWLRISLAYQNYDVRYRANSVDLSATVAAFIGFNTYIRSFYVKDSLVPVNANKLQGYWAFETSYLGFGTVSQGQVTPGGTTVPNPIAFTSPVPAGSCVVTGAFTSPLVITGTETNDVVVTVSLSTNQSFEWKDANMNNVYEPLNGDSVVDMGIRGLIPIVH